MRVLTKSAKMPWRHVLQHGNTIYSQKHLFVNNMLEMVRKYNTRTEALRCQASFSCGKLSVDIVKMQAFDHCVVAYCVEHDVDGDRFSVYGIGGVNIERVTASYSLKYCPKHVIVRHDE